MSEQNGSEPPPKRDLTTVDYTRRVRGWFFVILGMMALVYSVGVLVGRAEPAKQPPTVGCIVGVAFIVAGIALIRGFGAGRQS